MRTAEIVESLAQRTESKIVLLVLDGLGGIRTQKAPKTELELANIPNLNQLARNGVCGRITPVSPGVTPGSGPAHFSLFGYDPTEESIQIGRGALEALGLGMDLKAGDVATRCNFATIDSQSRLTDRRAGRIPTEECVRLCQLLTRSLRRIDDVDVVIEPGEQYRFVVVFKGPGLGGEIEDTDPQVTGVPALSAVPRNEASRKMASLADRFIAQANALLAKETKANSILMRGFSAMPHVRSMSDRWKLRPACIATYPLYRGVARVVGMEILQAGTEIADEFAALEKHWNDFDYFFIHIKKTDSYGEDGNPQGKIKILEEVDGHIPMIEKLNPAVIMVTGDHSTPPPMKSHSWHPVPFLLKAEHCGIDDAAAFAEAECSKGQLGVFPSYHITELALANAGKLKKFGA